MIQVHNQCKAHVNIQHQVKTENNLPNLGIDYIDFRIVLFSDSSYSFIETFVLEP